MDFFPDIVDLKPEQFRRFSELVFQKAGITMKENKITLLSNRLRRRMKELRMTDFDEYYRLLTSAEGNSELPEFLEAVTTNESYFWRTTVHFDLIKNRLLPDLIARYPGKKLGFYSAGCSTGEEPYNLAIELVESMKVNGVFDFEILAVDISKRVIDSAKAGRYFGRKIERIPPAILNRYFRQDTEKPDHFRVRDDIRNRVQFVNANLFLYKPAAPVHCVICRNVMIYFDRPTQEKLIDRFYEFLVPGGYLIVGHAESLHSLKTRFSHISFEEGTVYRRPLENGS